MVFDFEKNRSRKILCMLIAVIMLFCSVPTVVHAESVNTVSGWNENQAYKQYLSKVDYTCVNSYNGRDSATGAVVYSATGFELSTGYTNSIYDITTLKVTVGNAPVTIYYEKDECVETSFVSGNTVGAGGTITFTLTGKAGENKTGNVTINVEPSVEEIPEDAAGFSVSGNPYDYLDKAIKAAGSDGTIIVTKSGTAYPSTWKTDGTNYTFEIPSGVRLLVPHGGENLSNKNELDSCFDTLIDESSEEEPGSSQKANITLTLGKDTVLDSKGEICVNGKIHADSGKKTGLPTGAYGQIRLESESSKVIMNGGSLYCYGYITGDGMVIANSGTVYEVFQLLGWNGGSETAAWAEAAGITSEESEVTGFVFNDYAVQNIEADLIVNEYASSKGVASVTVSAKLFGDITKQVAADFVGAETGFIQLGENGSVRRSYEPSTNRMCYSLSGNAAVGGINIEIKFNDLEWMIAKYVFEENPLKLDSSSHILAIPYYMDFVAKTGSKVTLSNDYKLLPGATLTAETGSTVTVKGDLYIYDTVDYAGQGYVSGNSVPVKYIASVPKTSGIPKMTTSSPSGQVIVDGTLVIDGAVYTTEHVGTSVDKVLKGSGTIINNSSANKAVEDVLDEYIHGDAAIEYTKIRAIPVVGKIAGVSDTDTYHSFAQGIYYGAGNDFWYQHAVSADKFESIRNFKNISSAATVAVGKNRTLNQQETKIENVLGVLSKYLNEEGETVTTPFEFTVPAGATVASDVNSTITKTGGDSYSLTVKEGNTVLSTELPKDSAGQIYMRYDDRRDYSGSVVTLKDAGIPDSYQVGYGVAENSVKDTAVVKLENNVLIATGIGTAVVEIDGVETNVTVSAAPISMLFLAGQSNMQGSEGNSKQSIVCPEGMVYGTYGDRYKMNAANATQYAPSALTGPNSLINVEGTTSLLSDYPVMMHNAGVPTSSSNNEGVGKRGPDSGFAYQWVESTGEKVWVINAAHGGSSITKWQKDGSEYNEAVALFKACLETMRKEIAAGHYTLSHMGMYWCQGCTDELMTAEEYADAFLAMYSSLKEEVAVDVTGDGVKDNLEFANIVVTLAGHVKETGYRYEDGVYDSKDDNFFMTYEELEMRGQRVAQYWLASNPGYPEINMVCNIGENFVTMPDGSNGVQAYFQTHYENGVVDYTTQEKQSDSWYKPTTPKAVKDSIHYNQIGYNEVGREAVRNTMYLLGYAKDPVDVPTTVTFYDWTGYREVNSIDSSRTGNSATLVVPVVSPVYRSKDVSYKTTGRLDYNYFDLLAIGGGGGTLEAVGATGDKVVVNAYDLPENPTYSWGVFKGNLVSTGALNNDLAHQAGSIDSNGVFDNIVYSIDKPFTLKADKDWMLEWEMTITESASKGTYRKLFAQNGEKVEGDISILVRGDGTIAFGHYVSGSHIQYGISTGISDGKSHVYRLVNQVNKNGDNMVYLYVDDVLCGKMNNNLKTGGIDNWVNGMTTSISYIGQGDYAVTGFKIDNITVQETGASNGCIHEWSEWAISIEPTLETKGEESRTCSLCDAVDTRSIPKLSKYTNYRWELQTVEGTKQMVNTRGDNALSSKYGSIDSNGIFQNVRYQMEKPFNLNANEDWIVEWEMAIDSTADKTKYKKLFAENEFNAKDDKSIIINGEGNIAFGYYNGSGHSQYGVKTGITDGNYHKYRLVNRVNADGSGNMVYLYVDDATVGTAMNTAFKSGTDPNWVSGKSFNIGFWGQGQKSGETVNETAFAVNGYKIRYVYVQESGAVDECEHVWDEWTTTKEPAAGVAGEETRTCSLCGATESQEVPALAEYVSYRWELQTVDGVKQLVNTSGDNELTIVNGSIDDYAVFKQVSGTLDTPIELKADKDWIVEWEMAIDSTANPSRYKKLFAENAVNASGDKSIIINGDGNVAFGYYSGNHKQYGVATGISDGNYHRYRLVNKVNADGNGNMVYLFVDDATVGTAMNIYLGDTNGTESNWVNGKNFSFTSLGQGKKDGSTIDYSAFTVDGYKINYIYVQESGAAKECEHTWGEWEELSKPTAEAYGVKQRVCAICSETETQDVKGVWDVVDGFRGRVNTYTGEKNDSVNLWAKWEHLNGYYSNANWQSKNYSITFMIEGGDQIYSTSFGSAETNGSTDGKAGISLTFFDVYGNPIKKERAEVAEEFASKGYVEAPANAVAVCVPQWTNADTHEVRILNWHEHVWAKGEEISKPTADEKGKEQYVCTICSDEEIRDVDGVWDVVDEFRNRVNIYTGEKNDSVNLWTEWEHLNGYYSNANWQSKNYSITFMIEGGDQIYSTSFGSAETNGSTDGKAGISLTFFDVYGNPIKKERAEVAEEFASKGYVEAPANAVAVCVPQWTNADTHEVRVLNWPHKHVWSEWEEISKPTAESVGKKERVCTSCSEVETQDVLGVWQILSNLKTYTGVKTDAVNLWSEFYQDRIKGYYSGNTLSNKGDVHSIIFTVEGGDQIYSTSFGDASVNDNPEGNSGIVITYFDEYGKGTKVERKDVAAEFAKKGYVEVPDYAVAVCVPQWTDKEEHEVRILNWPEPKFEAQIGDTNYKTVAEAIEKAVSGDTVVLLADVEFAADELIVLKDGVVLDFNGHTMKANILGKLQMNNGLLITADKNYKMIGKDADYYQTEEAVITIGAQDITIEKGNVTLAQSWWTLEGQTLTIGADAVFTIPSGVELNVLSNVIVEGTVTLNGKVNLYIADATVKAEEGFTNIYTTAGDTVQYVDGVYKVHNHNYATKWNWTGNDEDEYSAVTATFTCDCGIVQSLTGKIDVVTTEATTEAEGRTVYTAKVMFNGEEYSDEKVVVIPVLIKIPVEIKNENMPGSEDSKSPVYGVQIETDIQPQEDGTTEVTVETVKTTETKAIFVHLVKYKLGDGTEVILKNTDQNYRDGKYIVPEDAVSITVDSGMLGDASNNGKIGMNDADLIRLHIAGKKQLGDLGKITSDSSGNGKIGMNDADSIRLHIAGKKMLY